jgi:hypothetical protein
LTQVTIIKIIATKYTTYLSLDDKKSMVKRDMITINKQEKHEEPPQEKPKNYRATKL